MSYNGIITLDFSLNIFFVYRSFSTRKKGGEWTKNTRVLNMLLLSFVVKWNLYKTEKMLIKTYVIIWVKYQNLKGIWIYCRYILNIIENTLYRVIVNPSYFRPSPHSNLFWVTITCPITNTTHKTDIDPRL